MKKCVACGVTKQGSEYLVRRDTGNPRPVCKQCDNERRSAARRSPGQPIARGAVPPTANLSFDIDESDLEKFKAERFEKLWTLSRAKGASVESVCNGLDVSPAALKRLIMEAKSAGYAVHVDGGQIGVHIDESKEDIIEIKGVVGDEYKAAAISDTHFGSKFHLPAQLNDFVNSAYNQGVREIFHSGDILEGCYGHSRWELVAHGIHEQAQYAISHLPRRPGLTYHCITGNHDQTFVDSCGIDVGEYLVSFFRRGGREDLFVHGNSKAYLKFGGALICLQHPKGAVPYAVSYRLQKIVEGFSPGLKPDILLAGHLHAYCQVEQRGVHAVLVPTFKGPGGDFSNSLPYAPSLGGCILSWGLTEHGTLRDFSAKRTSYYVNEKPRELA